MGGKGYALDEAAVGDTSTMRQYIEAIVRDDGHKKVNSVVIAERRKPAPHSTNIRKRAKYDSEINWGPSSKVPVRGAHRQWVIFRILELASRNVIRGCLPLLE